jgi:hypothetical protein
MDTPRDIHPPFYIPGEKMPPMNRPPLSSSSYGRLQEIQEREIQPCATKDVLDGRSYVSIIIIDSCSVCLLYQANNNKHYHFFSFLFSSFK